MNSNNLTTYPDISQRQAALMAGIGFLITMAAVSFGGFYVLPTLIVWGDTAATAENISTNNVLFRAGMISWLVMLAGDVLRAWGLYVFFRPVNQSLSLLAAWIMLIHVSMFGITQICLVFSSEILSGSDYLKAIDSDQLHSLMMLFIKGHNFGFLIGLFFFSFHLLILYVNFPFAILKCHSPNLNRDHFSCAAHVCR